LDELPPRVSREEDSFTECRKRIEPDARRFDAQFEGVEPFLLRDPYNHSWEVSGTTLRVISTDTTWGFRDAPEIWIYFRLINDDTCVSLVWMEIGEREDIADWEDIDF
jgi:hypothetical protein